MLGREDLEPDGGLHLRRGRRAVQPFHDPDRVPAGSEPAGLDLEPSARKREIHDLSRVVAHPEADGRHGRRSHDRERRGVGQLRRRRREADLDVVDHFHIGFGGNDIVVAHVDGAAAGVGDREHGGHGGRPNDRAHGTPMAGQVLRTSRTLTACQQSKLSRGLPCQALIDQI